MILTDLGSLVLGRGGGVVPAKGRAYSRNSEVHLFDNYSD